MLKIIEKTRLWFSISIIIIVIGLGVIAVRGLEFGIDFNGGTSLLVDMEKDFNKEEVDTIIKKYTSDFQSNKVKSTENNSIELEIKSANITNENISAMFKEIKEKYNLKGTAPVSQDTVGGSIGKELKQKAIIALVIATLAILVYIGFRFEFSFGMAAILSLIHDVLVTLAVYAIFRIPIDSGFIAAMLTVIGYSVNDTIVVFDRIRENQKYMRRNSIIELANSSITQTMARSINTVMTVMITITAVYFCVPSIRNFALPLIVGIGSGCYSSIFIATPIWVIMKNKKNNKKKAVA